MSYYETVFIARQDLTESQITELTESYSKILKDGGGKVHRTEYWGLRTLAYRINKARKAHYILIESETDAEALHEMERLMRLNEDVVRYMSLKVEELSDGPSVMMAKDEDTRDSRGPRPHGDRDNKDKKEAA